MTEQGAPAFSGLEYGDIHLHESELNHILNI